jgi:hypothetical protein
LLQSNQQKALDQLPVKKKYCLQKRMDIKLEWAHFYACHVRLDNIVFGACGGRVIIARLLIIARAVTKMHMLVIILSLIFSMNVLGVLGGGNKV